LSHSIEAIALLRAVLRENCSTDLAARHHLTEAHQLGVDPLDYCSHRFGLGNAAVWSRAATWTGLRFAASTPSRLPMAAIDDLRHLGEIRSFRQPVLGEDVMFVAPRFAQFLKLQLADVLAKRCVRVVPPDAIEAAMTRAASNQLMDEARQRVTRLWPRATASQDLPRHVRVTFVAILAGLIALVIAAGIVVRPVLVPVVAALLMAPGLMRMLAAFPAASKTTPRRLLTDHELPVYTVLIPLRDEAAMVPLLARAMAALDYPSEKLDIKFVVEQRSAPTVAAVEQVLDNPAFRIVRVPDGLPRTKPKAIDYALPLARGDYLVVYDAEDVPDPMQLRLAASCFAAGGDPRRASDADQAAALLKQDLSDEFRARRLRLSHLLTVEDYALALGDVSVLRALTSERKGRYFEWLGQVAEQLKKKGIQ